MDKNTFFLEHRRRLAEALPHGSIKIIAQGIPCHRVTVDKALTYGKEGEFYEQILDRAILILMAASSDLEFVYLYAETFGVLKIPESFTSIPVVS